MDSVENSIEQGNSSPLSESQDINDAGRSSSKRKQGNSSPLSETQEINDAGRSSSKRKATADLSINPHTIRARKRLARISKDPIQNQIEKAKAADQGAIKYARGKLQKSLLYQEATLADKERMIKDSEASVRLQRERDEKDWKTVAKSLGIGVFGGLYAQNDDGNPAWEDIEYEQENEFEFEQRWREDERFNQDGQVEKTDAKDIHLAGITRIQQAAQDKKALVFRTWQKKWQRSQRSLFRKTRNLSAGGFEWLLRNTNAYIANGQFHSIPGPDKFFTSGEKAIWRNLTEWVIDTEWVELPGPAAWWPDDIDGTGFYFSDKATGHREAMELVLSKGEIDYTSFNRVFPSESDLRVMDDNSDTRMALDAYFSIGRY